LEVSVVGSYFYTTFFCYALDISSTGLLIETDMILKKGKIVSCLLSLPDSRQITVHGKIMRVTIKSNDIYRYGINFYDLKTDTRSAIEAFIGKQTSMK
jgi:Tfp pilus assembly protein PilZ